MHALVLGLLLVAAPAFAADVDDGPGASTRRTARSRSASRSRQTARRSRVTTTGPDGTATPITNGMIDGDDITFTVAIEGPMLFTMNYKGVVKAADGQIDLTADIFGMPIEMVVKKVE